MRTRRTVRVILAFQAIILFCVIHTWADDSASVVCQRDGKPQACNGVSVGEPKVFDNRTLTLMLEALSQTLASQQQSYIDQKSVLAALANLQGFTQTETARALNITGVPTPATSLKDTLKTGNVDSSGKALPDALTRESNVSRASVTPQAPALESFPAIPGFNPTYGQNAADLLNDQVNLTYQIFNLRMLLERSLSDRLMPDTPGPPDKNRTRLQAVLGFNVTLDPPRTANDAVAVVEITVTISPNQNGAQPGQVSGNQVNQGNAKSMSLVALMPQEKTYNAATLSNKSNAFGGSAVVNAFQVGYSQRKREQIFYIYRDNDTLSYERMTGDPNKIVFGWMFRPVLGRNSVSPGLRQMFAIMALPENDCIESELKGGASCSVKLESHVRTYWKKYDRGTLSSYEHHDTNRAKAFWFKLSAGLSKPQIFSDRRYENDATYAGQEVRSSAEYENYLKPQITSVEWRPTGAKNVIVSVTGNNLFTNTQVAMGDKLYTKPGDGLIFKSSQGFDLITTLDALANGPGTVIGRYGVGVPLIQKTLPEGVSPNGVEIIGAGATPLTSGNRRLTIEVRGKAPLKASREERTAQLKFWKIKSELQDVQGKISVVEGATRAVQSAKGKAQSHAQEELKAVIAKLGSLSALQQEAATTAKSLASAEQQKEEKQQILAEYRTLGAAALTRYSPVISVNGNPLELPYSQYQDEMDGHWSIEANLPDSYLSDGGGVVKISWPFYAAENWTASLPINNPDRAFPVTRVSQKSILISRIDGLSFVNGPESEGHASPCWNLIAGEQIISLTPGCETQTALPECPKKEKSCLSSLPLNDYTLAASAANDLPDKVVLVAPNGATYTLAVPELKAKETKVQPLEIRQYDSLWIEVTSAELKTTDLSKVTVVEANGTPLKMVPQKATDANQKVTIKSIKMEITRALTEKPGTVDIAFRASDGGIIGTRQLQITRTEWAGRGDK